MPHGRESRRLETVLSVAGITLIAVRWAGELTTVRISVAVLTESLSRHVADGRTLWLMTFHAIERCVLSFELERYLLMRLSRE